jgi:hypothetical protein
MVSSAHSAIIVKLMSSSLKWLNIVTHMYQALIKYCHFLINLVTFISYTLFIYCDHFEHLSLKIYLCIVYKIILMYETQTKNTAHQLTARQYNN